MAISIIIFLVIFCILVVSHEFGHYIIGKKNGIHANEFFIGVGPKLFHFTKDGTEFSVRLLPFGGACVFKGLEPEDIEEDEEEVDIKSKAELGEVQEVVDIIDDSEAGEDIEPSYDDEDDEGSFLKAPVWGRIATTLAGPLFNVILAYLCGAILASATGVVIPEIRSVMPGSGAEEAGLMEGDIIVKINSHSVHLSDEVSFASFYSAGESMKITVKRNGEKKTFTVTPKYSEEDQRYYIGITNGRYLECNLGQSLLYGAYNVQYILRATLDSLRMLFTGQVGKDDLAGPVGMVKMVDDTYEQSKHYGALSVLLSMVYLMMLLSANLAVMNLLPIPALDGGRLVFLLIEAVRGKPVPADKEGYVHLAGMALLFALMIFVLFNDISKFFR